MREGKRRNEIEGETRREERKREREGGWETGRVSGGERDVDGGRGCERGRE